MRWGMVCSPACSAEVSIGCMPLPVECRYCSRGPGMCVGAFFPGEAASSDPWLKASLCRNGLGWGLGCSISIQLRALLQNIQERGEHGSES